MIKFNNKQFYTMLAGIFAASFIACMFILIVACAYGLHTMAKLCVVAMIFSSVASVTSSVISHYIDKDKTNEE